METDYTDIITLSCIDTLKELFSSLSSLNYNPQIKIEKKVGPTIIVNLWLNNNVFFKMEIHYCNDVISPVYLIGNNVRIELLNCNIKSIEAILLSGHLFKLNKEPFISIIVKGKLNGNCEYKDTNMEDYTIYCPIEFNVESQNRIMSLVLQKNNQGQLSLFKVTVTNSLYLLNNLSDHPIFNLFDFHDNKNYLLKQSNPRERFTNVMNQRYLNYNSNKEYDDQITMLINLIGNIITNNKGKKVSITEIVMNTMYYLNLKFNDKIYYIVFEPKYHEILKVYINDFMFIINLNTIRLDETYKLLYNLVTVVDFKCSYDPDKPSGEREYEEYEMNKKTEDEEFTEICEESWLTYLFKPFRFNFFSGK